MTTFRSVVKPNKKVVSTDLAGTLNLEDKYNSVDFTAAQSVPVSNLTNTLHLIDGQTVRIHNKGSSDILIDASLMEDNRAIDIEQDTTALLFYMKTTGTFKDQGGTARIKDLEDDFAAHTHNGADAPKIDAVNLNSDSVANRFLMAKADGTCSWQASPGYKNGRFRSENTDTTTNINSTTVWGVQEVPLMGNPTRVDSDYTVIGNSVRCNFTGRIRCSAHVHIYCSKRRVNPQIRFFKNEIPVGPIGNSYLRDSDGNQEASPAILDEIDVENGDIIKVYSRRESSRYTVYMASVGSSVLNIERVE